MGAVMAAKSRLFSPARDEILIRAWPTMQPVADIMRDLNAVDADTLDAITLPNQVAYRAMRLKLSRPDGICALSLVHAWAALRAGKIAKWHEWKPAVDAMRAAGKSWHAIRNALNTSGATMREFRDHFGYVDTPPPPPPPPPPKPRAQTVEEWIAAGGQIKRCPVAMAARCQATIPPEDRAALIEHHAALEAAKPAYRKRGDALRAVTWRRSAHIRQAKGLPA